MPRHFQPFVAPPKFGLVVPAPITIDNWAPTVGQKAVVLRYAPCDIAAPPKALPPYQFTIAEWTPTICVNAQPQRFALPDVAAPPKALPPYQFTIAEWTPTIGVNAQPQRFASPDVATPPKALPPYQVTLSEWLPTEGIKAQPLDYARPDFVAPDKFGLTAPATPTIAGWASTTGVNAQPQDYARTDFVGPDKFGITGAPATPTIAGWASTSGEVARTLVYVRAQDSPLKGAVIPLSVTLPGWLFEAPPGARQLIFSRGDAHSSPVATIPATIAPVTLANWTPTAAQVAVILRHTQALEFAAPDKFGILVAASPTIGSWLATIGEIARQLGYSRPDAAAPAKVLPSLESITLDKWNPAAAAPLYRALFTKFAELGMPAKALPPAPITLAQWLTTDAKAGVRYRFWLPEGLSRPVFVPVIPGPFVIFAKLILAYAAMLAGTPNATAFTGFESYPQMVASGGIQIICLD
jgi:hypothetical protein